MKKMYITSHGCVVGNSLVSSADLFPCSDAVTGNHIHSVQDIQVQSQGSGKNYPNRIYSDLHRGGFGISGSSLANHGLSRLISITNVFQLRAHKESKACSSGMLLLKILNLNI